MLFRIHKAARQAARQTLHAPHSHADIALDWPRGCKLRAAARHMVTAKPGRSFNIFLFIFDFRQPQVGMIAHVPGRRSKTFWKNDKKNVYK